MTKVKCNVCGFKCDDRDHEIMTTHMWEYHTTKVTR